MTLRGLCVAPTPTRLTVAHGGVAGRQGGAPTSPGRDALVFVGPPHGAPCLAAGDNREAEGHLAACLKTPFPPAVLVAVRHEGLRRGAEAAS